MPPAAALHVEGVEGTERRLLAEATTCRLVPRAVSGDEQAAWRRGVISGDGGTRGGVVLMDWWCARATAARQLKVELSRALPRGVVPDVPRLKISWMPHCLVGPDCRARGGIEQLGLFGLK